YEPPATTNPPLTKLREYVHSGGRVITREKKSCVPTLSPGSANLPEGGGTWSFNVSTPHACSWAATSNDAWITGAGGSSGAGNGTVSYSVAANSGGQRIGTISVNGRAFTVTQAPNPASCAFALSPGSQLVGARGGSGSFNVTAGAGCLW